MYRKTKTFNINGIKRTYRWNLLTKRIDRNRKKITYAIEQAIKLKLPLIICCVSVGTRMQKGIILLMQMAKITAVISKLN